MTSYYPWWAVVLVGLIGAVYGMSGEPRWWKTVLMALAFVPIYLFTGVTP